MPNTEAQGTTENRNRNRQTNRQNRQGGRQNRNQRPFIRPMPRQTSGVEEAINLNTREAIIIWRNCSESVRSNCANLQLRLAATMNPSDYAALEEVVQKDLKRLKEQAQSQLDSINHQIKGKKLASISFEGTREFKFSRNSPLFKEFVDGIRALDGLFTIVESLWLDGMFTSAKRGELNQNWSSAYNNMARQIQQLVGQALNQQEREREQQRKEREQRIAERAKRRAERNAQEAQGDTKDNETSKTSDEATKEETTEVTTDKPAETSATESKEEKSE